MTSKENFRPLNHYSLNAPSHGRRYCTNFYFFIVSWLNKREPEIASGNGLAPSPQTNLWEFKMKMKRNVN